MLADIKLHSEIGCPGGSWLESIPIVKCSEYHPCPEHSVNPVSLKAGVKRDLHFPCLSEVKNCWPMWSFHILGQRFVLSGPGSQCHPNASALNPIIKTRACQIVACT